MKLPEDIAREFLANAVALGADESATAPRRTALALTSIAASLVATSGDEETSTEAESWAEEFKGRLDRARQIVGVMDDDIPDPLVRWIVAILEGRELPPTTPEDPEPGRDWSAVEAHLFKPSGKWEYEVRLDYTGERFRGVPGEGPHGWHFDGDVMAKRALARATDNGTSRVTIRELGSYWTMFVPHPPQGYPLWVKPNDPDVDPAGFTPNAGEMFP